jgi:hypothetical protein
MAGPAETALGSSRFVFTVNLQRVVFGSSVP